MDATPTRTTSKGERNKLLYDDYCLLVAAEPKAELLPRSYFYDQLADKYFIESKTVSRIINTVLKRGRLKHAN